MLQLLIDMMSINTIGMELEKWLGSWELDGINSYIRQCWDIDSVDCLEYDLYINEVANVLGSYRLDTFIRDVADLYDIDYYMLSEL